MKTWTRAEIIEYGRQCDFELLPTDIDGVDGALTIDGMPADEWIDLCWGPPYVPELDGPFEAGDGRL